MLKPLEEWVCDKCHHTIANADEGYLEWISTADGAHSFKIIHDSQYSPRSSNKGCSHFTDKDDISDNQLSEFVGVDGMANLLAFLDVGPVLDPKEEHMPQVNIREVVELIRRLTIPYYEEARSHWDAAKEDNYFEGANEVSPYFPDSLKRLIEIYSD